MARTGLVVWQYCEGWRYTRHCTSFSAAQALYGRSRLCAPAHSEIEGLTERRRFAVTGSGGLIDSNEKQDASRRAILLRDHIREFQNAISAIEKCPQPVIGVAHGVSFGLAIDILCACDIRYAASDTRFSIKVGVISQPLIRILIFNMLSTTGGRCWSCCRYRNSCQNWEDRRKPQCSSRMGLDGPRIWPRGGKRGWFHQQNYLWSPG